MRKLLNTVYVTNEQSYLTLDGENIVCRVDGEIALRIPFDNVENIVHSYKFCFTIWQVFGKGLRRDKGKCIFASCTD